MRFLVNGWGEIFELFPAKYTGPAHVLCQPTTTIIRLNRQWYVVMAFQSDSVHGHRLPSSDQEKALNISSKSPRTHYVLSLLKWVMTQVIQDHSDLCAFRPARVSGASRVVVGWSLNRERWLEQGLWQLYIKRLLGPRPEDIA